MLAYVLLTRGEQVERWRLAAFGCGCLPSSLPRSRLSRALSYHLLSMHLLPERDPRGVGAGAPRLGYPASAAERLARAAVQLLTRPPVALGVWLLVYFTWHLPPAYDAALKHPVTLLHLERAMYLGAGALLYSGRCSGCTSPLEREPERSICSSRVHPREPDRAPRGAGAGGDL